jgi:hypothetical protein
VQAVFLGFGTPVAPPTPVEFARLATADSAKWQAVIRRFDIRPN